ncbi:MAG TPA: FGGY-family carbohydrate kinase [Aggregatilineaceae bacterium]|nr:FGGY-family carbohydrate kinase [Aggregatilineaceae bacterium]
MDKDLIIGIDSSTTACKAIAWDRTGHPISESRVDLELLSPQPNWYEQHAEDWWDTLVAVLRALTAQIDARRVAALCIAHQRETFVLVDEDCQPIRNAILWMDDRSRHEVTLLERHPGYDYIQQVTGKGPSTKQALPKLLWLQTHEPDVLPRTYKILDVHAFLTYRLTNRWVTSLPSADPMAIVDMQQGVLASPLLEKLGIDPGKFVEIVPPGTILGEITRHAAELTGLLPGIPLIAGVGDGQSAGLGANITGPGRAYLNLGTAMVSGAHSDTYVADRAFRTMCSAIKGAYVLEGVLASGTFIVRWFVEQFGPDVRGLGLPLAAEELLELAARKLPPGSLGLMLVPYWGAVLSPYWDAAATGITIGWTGAHRREHFYRAILEGLAFEHRLVMDGMSNATHQTINEFTLMGGGSRSDLWCHIIADVTGKPVARASTAEASNLGAAIVAASSMGWYPNIHDAANAMTRNEQRFDPHEATCATYNRLYTEVYQGLFPALQTYIDRLTELTYQ